MTDLEAYYKELVEGRKKGLANLCLLTLLNGCAVAYANLMRLRAAAYAVGVLPVRRLNRPVISVGNIVAGGTGKTPTVAWLARHFMAKGKRVAVLTRGYGGTLAGSVAVVSDGEAIYLSPEEAGDEPLLLAGSIAGLIVVVGADRYKAGLLAQERFAPDLFILDDGFQHMRLYRDINIVLLDCERPFGNGRTFPAGLLREPQEAVKRADLVILTRCNSEAGPAENLLNGCPVCRSNHHLSGFAPLGGGDIQPFCELAGRRGLAFAGIADPAAFFSSLEKAGVHPVATLAFPDHTNYGEEEIAALCRLVTASRTTYLITTEKDAVKLHPHLATLGTVYVAPLELQFSDATIMEELLEKLL